MSFDDDAITEVPLAAGYEVDAPMLTVVLNLLERARDVPGMVERELHDDLGKYFPNAEPADINNAIREARVGGLVVLVEGRLVLDRRITPRQLVFLKAVLSMLALRQRRDEP